MDRVERAPRATVGWLLEPFVLLDGPRPLAEIDPYQVELVRSTSLPRAWWSHSGPSKIHKKKSADRWAMLLDGIDDESESSEEEKPPSVVEDEDLASPPSSGESDRDSSTSGSSSTDGDSGGDDGEAVDAPPPPPPFEEPAVEDDAMADAEVGAPAAELAAAADVAPPARAKAGARGVSLEMAVPGGLLRFYDRSQIVVAHCERHGLGKCRLTRTLRGSDRANRAAQGRPLGLLFSWLQCEDHGDPRDRDALPTLAERQAGRAAFADLDESDRFLALERPQRDGEEDEPEDLP